MARETLVFDKLCSLFTRDNDYKAKLGVRSTLFVGFVKNNINKSHTYTHCLLPLSYLVPVWASDCMNCVCALVGGDGGGGGGVAQWCHCILIKGEDSNRDVVEKL